MWTEKWSFCEHFFFFFWGGGGGGGGGGGSGGYGTVRPKTSSSRDDSLQTHFSKGTVHPGTVRSICKKCNKSFLKKLK